MIEPLISIVVPFYNTDLKLFKNCINTIVNQDYKNKEIIIVDDGSDFHYSVELDIIESNSRDIRVIHQKNKGEGGARNTGIDNSNGEYIVFVDSDDGLAKGWLSYSMKVSLKYDADVVAGQVVRTLDIPIRDEFSDEIFCSKITQSEKRKLQRDFFYFQTDLVEGMKVLDPGVCSKLIRKKCIENLRFPLNIKLSSDQVFNHNLIVKSDTIVLTNRISYYYVTNYSSVSNIFQPNAVAYMMKSMSLIEPLVYNNNECNQAFYFRVLSEIMSAIQYSCFSKDSNMKLSDKKKGVECAFNHPLVEEVIYKMDIRILPNNIWKFKAFLVKYKMSISFIIIKKFTDLMKGKK